MRILLLVWALSAQANLVDYYRQVYLGEAYSPTYSGPLHPAFEFSSDEVRYVNKDQLFFNSLIDSSFSDLVGLKDFVSQSVETNSLCSNELMGENIVYMRYLFRLLSLSYLFEASQVLAQESSFYTSSPNRCDKKLLSSLKLCRPKGRDMKTFLKRAPGRMEKMVSALRPEFSTPKEQKKFVPLFMNRLKKINYPQEVLELHARSFPEFKNMNSLSDQTCEWIQGHFKSICSENDELYGMKQLDVVRDVIRSYQFPFLERGNSQCLNRYIDMFSIKERVPDQFVRLMDFIFKKLKESNAPYIQGNLFFVGALKEFDELGLTSLIKEEKKEVIRPTVTKKAKKKVLKKKVVQKPRPLPKPLIVNKPIEKKTIKKSPKTKVTKVTEFERAREFVYDRGFESREVKEAKLRKDYEFKREDIKFLREVLKPYLSYDALKEMKEYDKLGTAKEPMRLSLLKFLMDEKDHRAMFNIMSILGNKFFVLNDLERKKEPVLFQMKNDEQTNWKWKYFILKPVY